MAIDNDYIAEQFSLLAKLMDIHGENSFKTRSYSVAAFTLEKLPTPIQDIPADKLTSIKGIGDAIGKKIREIIETGELRLLQQYIAGTPPGVIEMLRIKGLGPKKIATIWKEMEIESVGELLYACQENRLLLYKGFGEKTQAGVREAIEFRLRHIGSHLFADIEPYAESLEAALKKTFPAAQLAATGEFRRQLETITKLEFVTTATVEQTEAWLTANPSEEGVTIEFINTTPENFAKILFETSCSGEFLEAFREKTSPITATSEEELFSQAGLPYIPPYRREQRIVLDRLAGFFAGPGPSVSSLSSAPSVASVAPAPSAPSLQPSDIRAIIHSHSKWSDGSNTLPEMAAACIERGLQYLVISDHSKSAGYANGLQPERVQAQHAEIDELNRKLAPFVIFKSIESDILGDGNLDYSGDILSTFDLVIASVHSNLKMTEEKAMSRLIRAIENPYTTILGHLTGRLLLSRPGYPVDHKKIIDACVANHVVIELNAHPRRLDMDWRWIGYALDKGALISIDPDAHSINGYNDIRYGVLAARKAGVTPDKNLSSFTLDEFNTFLEKRKKSRGI
ncbi:MAG TPA: helix-hairpin-helix domain-containing protein [Puia sp.]|jgi:DNA polymerase (family 10)|nr:helix-hairpin-helix domain-containing protein [Puia sp.]